MAKKLEQTFRDRHLTADEIARDSEVRRNIEVEFPPRKWITGSGQLAPSAIMPSIYTFTEYSPDWPVEFNREAERLRSLLGDEFVDVHHIGSTSVPGLAAKPIIDLLPVVRDIGRIDELSPLLEEAGYKAWGEYGLPGRRLFTKDRGAHRTHNVHIYPTGHPDIDRHLAFCAFLRSNEKARNDYEALKREAYSRHPSDINAYSDVKDAWIKQIEPIAVEWYRRQV